MRMLSDALRGRAKSKAGWVYVLTNRALKEDLVKIGRTIRTPKERAAELSANTAVPLPFEVAHAVFVKDCYAVERAVHRQLARRRVHKGREFFAVSASDAIRAVDLAAMRPRRRRRWILFALILLVALGGAGAALLRFSPLWDRL